MSIIVSCSDIHKSPRDGRAAFDILLERLLSGDISADMLVIIGDYLERARHHLGEFITDPTTRAEIDRLNDLSHKMDVWLLLGNHDPIASDYTELLGKGSKVRIAEELHLGAERLYFTHGWQFDLGLSWLAPVYKKIFRWFPDLAFLWDRYMKTPAKVKAEVHNPGIRYYQYAQYVYSMVTLAMGFAFKHTPVDPHGESKKPLKLIFGHTHQAGTYEFDNRIVVANTGDMLEDSDYLVIHNGDITLYSIFPLM